MPRRVKILKKNPGSAFPHEIGDTPMLADHVADAWVEAGIADELGRRPRQSRVETTEAAGPPENAAERTEAPEPRAEVEKRAEAETDTAEVEVPFPPEDVNVSDLPDALSEINDVAVLRALQDADSRKTSGKHYERRIDELSEES